MPLRYPKSWKFGGFAHSIPIEAHRRFVELVEMIVEGTSQKKRIYEDFKSAFGESGSSSDTSWAQHDMTRAMSAAMGNAARYVAAYYVGLEAAEARDLGTPSVEQLNAILAEYDVPLVIEPPDLRLRAGDIAFVQASADSAEQALSTKFVLGPELGRGGFGRVWQVIRRTQLGDYHYAMKVLAPSVFIENKDRANKRFLRELRTLEKLQHRAIIPLLEAGMTPEDDPYILMPLIEGMNIRDALEGASPERVFEVFDEVFNAIEFAHEHNVLHRDLKPSNVLVREADGQPLVLDFGCAYLLDEEDEGVTTTLVGTSAYVPEEVLLDPTKHDFKRDIYACGIMLYETVARCFPDRADYEPLAHGDEAYATLDRGIERAVASERKRISSASDLRSEFEAFGKQFRR